MPARLAEKLEAIRQSLSLTGEEMAKRLDLPQLYDHRASITKYEKGRRELPSLIFSPTIF